MKTILTAAFVLLIALIWLHRDRIYLRDPLATVYRDATPQSGIQVYINGANEVLLQKESEPNPYRLLIQRANPTPGTPIILRCIHWMACLTDSAQPSTIPLAPTPAYKPQTTITDRETTFTTPEGNHLRITLR